VSGLSHDLYAGNSTHHIIVTNPMFLNYTLNDTFLTGDIPVLGVNAYGTGLTGGETVNFEVWDENTPEKIYTASGASFERVNIPLWEMDEEGAHALIIKAVAGNGLSDGVKHSYQVLQTYHKEDVAVYYDVTPKMTFDAGTGGLTRISFTDRSRGQYLWQLIGMRYVYGDRIEKLLARREANKLIETYFPDLSLYGGKKQFEPRNYQRNDGGIAVLPYAGSDLETTVRLMPYILDEVNKNALTNYLYDIYEGSYAYSKMCALYGLAQLKEPVLLDLDRYAMLDNLSVKDIIYVALAYCALGETETAAALYDDRILPVLEKIPPYCRVNTGADQDDILEATSAASHLAARLDKPEREGLYLYCIKNHTSDILINIETLSYIKHEIEKSTETSGSITYTLFGQEYTRTIKNGSSYTLSIPALNIDKFELLDVTGDVSAVSVYKAPLTQTGDLGRDITVTRRYYPVNKTESGALFSQGDLIRVELQIDYGLKAMDGAYCVTDYLPSGLEYVQGSAKIDGVNQIGYGHSRYASVEGQQVIFYDYNGTYHNGYIYYYYAKVISPGVYRAEGTMVQNLNAKDYFTVGEDNVITIR
jgi:hypothetical protein